MKSKTILIVSASIGQGHIKAASTIAGELTAAGFSEISNVDFLEAGQFRYPALNRLQKELLNLMKSSYYGLLKTAPTVYKGLYKITENQQAHKVIAFMNAANQQLMEHLVAEHQPQAVICTHPFPLGAAAALRSKKGKRFLLAGVITDFTAHPWWMADKVDHYFVANQELAGSMEQYGILPGKITASGIPVDCSFSPGGRGTLCRGSNILIMGGSLGFGSMETALYKLEGLPQSVRVTVVSGKNEALYRRINALKNTLRNTVTVLPFSNRIAGLMREADLLITKPGGLTCSEALAVNLPMVLLNPLPGQEEENARYLHRQGAAFWVQEETDIAATVAAILDKNSGILQSMRGKCREISPQDAGRAIADKISQFIENQPQEQYACLEGEQKAGGMTC